MRQPDFRKLVQEMRNAQKEYRRAPTKPKLMRVEDLEGKVDQALDDTQKELFS